MKKNKVNILRSIVLSSCLLSLTIITSFIEIKIPLFNGGEFDLRIFDTIFLFLAVSLVRLPFATLIGGIQPWMHLLIDGDHSPISILFYSITNIILSVFFWFIYYKCLKLNNLAFKDKKYKKITYYLILNLTLSLVEVFMDLASIFSATVINLGIHSKQALLFKNFKSITTIILILTGLYISKFIFVILFYEIIANKIKPLLYTNLNPQIQCKKIHVEPNNTKKILLDDDKKY